MRPETQRRKKLGQSFDLLGLGLFLVTELCGLLGLGSLDLALAGGLGLCTLGVHLLAEDSLTSLLGLGLVDLFQSVSHCVLPGFVDEYGCGSPLTCSTSARLCLKVLPLLKW